MKAIDKFQEFLQAGKFKRTRTREALFREVFSGARLHLNAREIHDRLKKKGYRISLATVYRTLNLLVESGLVSEVDLGESHGHFEPGITKTGHGHLICLSCGKVREFTRPDIRKALDRLGKEKGFRFEKYCIQIFGTCRACQKRQ